MNLDLQHLKHVIIEMPLSPLGTEVIHLDLAGPPLGSWTARVCVCDMAVVTCLRISSFDSATV